MLTDVSRHDQTRIIALSLGERVDGGRRFLETARDG
jgi:hypothetical protein